MGRVRLACVVAVGAALTILTSCGPRAIGWGVVLWGDATGPYAHGSVVAITRDSQINDSYLAIATGERQPREIPHGLLRAFQRQGQAQAYAKTLEPWLSTWAFSRKEDTPPLPIRGEPDQTSKTVYRLRYGEIVKVIGRTDQKVVVKPYEDYWYEVVTQDGSSGWCFAHLLKVYASAGDPSQEKQQLLAQDDVLERILTTTWRPDAFRTMVARGRVNLDALREDVGLFPDPENRVFRLGLTRETLEFRYQRMDRMGTSTYAAVGTDLRITILDDTRISVSYQKDGQIAGGIYAVFPGEIADVITGEVTRRQGLFDALRARGATLSSDSYGTIRLEEGMRFHWEEYDRLVPDVVAAGAGSSGTVDFPYHVGRELAGEYDGVITLTFDGSGQAVSFLYQAATDGLRLTSLVRAGFDDIDVVRPGISPMVIFLSQSP